MRILLKSLVIILLFILGGCASGPKFNEVSSTFSPQQPDTGRIFFYRNSALGAAIKPDVKLNGKVVGEAISKGFFYVDKEPGNYEILTSTEVDRKLSLTLSAGQVRFVKFNVNMGFFVAHVYPELVETEMGKEEIQECSYTGKP